MVKESSLFFFSSRRRHTRYWRDWSSDVCSSDLAGTTRRSGPTRLVSTGSVSTVCPASSTRTVEWPRKCRCGPPTGSRSEERRVGKEGRSRASPYHEKKKYH